MPTSLTRALLSLEGLSVGDAFGELFFALPFTEVSAAVADRRLSPDRVWPVTDDTLLAAALVDTLATHGKVDQPHLAMNFARHFDPNRGFGRAMHDLLPQLTQGDHSQAAALFNDIGSCGNGSAMRVAPLGAFFADDLSQLRLEAERSATVTHTHSEAIAGAYAVALASALAWRSRTLPIAPDATSFLSAVHAALPESDVRDGIARALEIPADTNPIAAAAILGNGSRVTCQDTVPFVLWSAAHSLDSYEEALWRTVAGGGDKDTTCAMVGGIVVLRTGLDAIPALWRQHREPLTAFLPPDLTALLS